MVDSKHGRGLAATLAAAASRTRSTSPRRIAQIDRYEEQKDAKTVTLNKEKFLKERAELDADKEQEEMFDDMTDPKRPVLRNGRLRRGSARHHGRLPRPAGRQQGRRRPTGSRRRTVVARTAAVDGRVDRYEAHKAPAVRLRRFFVAPAGISNATSAQSAARRTPAPCPPAAPRSSPRAPARATCA